MAIPKLGTRKEPLSTDQFHDALKEWEQRHADDDGEVRIDGGTKFGQCPWIWVKSRTGTKCYLNGDTKLRAVREYLERLKKNPKLTWPKGNEGKDAFRVDPGGEYLECFQFYRLKKQD